MGTKGLLFLESKKQLKFLQYIMRKEVLEDLTLRGNIDRKKGRGKIPIELV